MLETDKNAIKGENIMEQEIENFKISQIKSAVYSCIIDLSIIATQIGVIIKLQQPVNIETYNPKNFYMKRHYTMPFCFFLLLTKSL